MELLEAVELKHRRLDVVSTFSRGMPQRLSIARALVHDPDVVFLDPPRAGSTPEFIAALAKMAPKKAVYVSCDPTTLARDLALFAAKGYKARAIQPVDMFPHTEHIEVVCELRR